MTKMIHAVLAIALLPFMGRTTDQETATANEQLVADKFLQEGIDDKSITLCAFDVNSCELYVSKDRKITYDLPKEQKVVVRGYRIGDKIFLEVDAKLRFNDQLANGLARGLSAGLGKNFAFSTAATDTTFKTKVVLLEKKGGAWKVTEASQYRSFERDMTGKYALFGVDGSYSYGIGAGKMYDLVRGDLSFEKKGDADKEARLQRPLDGFQIAIFNKEKKTLTMIDFSGNEVSGSCDGPIVKKVGEQGYSVVTREKDAMLSIIGEVKSPDEAKMDAGLYRAITLKTAMPAAHKAPESMANAK